MSSYWQVYSFQGFFIILNLDEAIGKIFEACQTYNYVLMVTSDHGNAEKMIAPDGSEHTAHTCNLGLFLFKFYIF